MATDLRVRRRMFTPIPAGIPEGFRVLIEPLPLSPCMRSNRAKIGPRDVPAS